MRWKATQQNIMSIMSQIHCHISRTQSHIHLYISRTQSHILYSSQHTSCFITKTENWYIFAYNLPTDYSFRTVELLSVSNYTDNFLYLSVSEVTYYTAQGLQMFWNDSTGFDCARTCSKSALTNCLSVTGWNTARTVNGEWNCGAKDRD